MENTQEKSALNISIVGSTIFGALGITFAILTQSQAVLLDGAFNMVAAVMAFIGLKIASSLHTPESEHYPVGLYALESLFVLAKGLILMSLTIYVIFNNIIILVNGGSSLNLGVILIYLAVALTGNVIAYLIIRKKSRKADSPIVNIEAENWKVNTMITGSILVAILISYLLKDSFLKEYVRYIDQVIVITVAVVSMPVPVKAIKNGLRELLLFAPPEDFRKKIHDLIDQEKAGFENVNFRNSVLLKTGRKIWVTLFVYSKNDMLPTDLSDQIRQKVSSSLSGSFKDHNVDVIISNQEG